MSVDALLDRASAICLALPEATTKLSHGSPAFQVAGKKMFAYFVAYKHGDDNIALWLKTSGLDEQAMLIEADPDIFYRPPYVGVAGWVAMRLDGGAPDWDAVEDRVRASYRLVAPRRLAALV